MKKLLIKSVSLVLILIMSALMMFSCDWFDLVYRGDPNGIYPDGYTGGFGIHGQSGEEIWWVETYEECLAAIEQLKAHGSTFYYDSLFVYEGDAFDTKYCFRFSGKDDRIKFGDNPFDRYAKDICIETYAFFDDVTIDEINYSLLRDYEAYFFYASFYYIKERNNISFDQFIIKEWNDDDDIVEQPCRVKKAYYKDEVVFFVQGSFSKKSKDIPDLRMTDEIVSEILERGWFISLK